MFAKFKRPLSFMRTIRELVSHPARRTYFPNCAQKGRMAILIDNLVWLFKYGQLNRYYYLYGLDLKNSRPANFMHAKNFYRVRDRINEQGTVGRFRANYICLLRDKFIFGQFLKSLGFACPPTLALCDKQNIDWLDTAVSQPLENIVMRNCDCFIKPLLSEMAHCVYPLKVENKTIYISGRPGDVEQLRAVIDGKSMLQQRIVQHPELSRMYPFAINTIRVVTACNCSSIKVLSAILRVGTASKFCDNWGAGGIAVGIDMKTSRLVGHGFFRPDFGKITPVHPDTKIAFEGFEIPFFKDVLEYARRLHGFFYGIQSIGWDFAITPDGPLCLEGNDNWGLPMMQIFDDHIVEKYFKTLKK